ncbi:hypothetical protein MMC09_000088 [Bachmanniomyces sp. S44760]|nr:hypothetical protein [Bachmanniomyces sp. S44760]
MTQNLPSSQYLKYMKRPDGLPFIYHNNRFSSTTNLRAHLKSHGVMVATGSKGGINQKDKQSNEELFAHLLDSVQNYQENVNSS